AVPADGFVTHTMPSPAATSDAAAESGAVAVTAWLTGSIRSAWPAAAAGVPVPVPVAAGRGGVPALVRRGTAITATATAIATPHTSRRRHRRDRVARPGAGGAAIGSAPTAERVAAAKAPAVWNPIVGGLRHARGDGLAQRLRELGPQLADRWH